MARELPKPRGAHTEHRNAREREVGSHVLPARVVARARALPPTPGELYCDACGGHRTARWVHLGGGVHACSMACADAILERLGGIQRPRCRADCVDGPRPCPWVRCWWHLYLDVSPAGGVRFNFPDLEPWELEESCALDVIERGGLGPHDIAKLLNMTRERARMLLAHGMRVARRGLERFR